MVGLSFTLTDCLPISFGIRTGTKLVSELHDIDAGAAMTLADDAITASKFDESTAFPLKSADSGATAVSRLTAADVNAEADTALSDVGLTTTVTGRIDAAVSTRSSHSAADVWAVATRLLSTSPPTVEEIDAELTANHGAGLWTSAVTGSGDVYVTDATLDDEGDDMAFETSGGAGIGGATVKAFVTSEYTAGTFTVRAQTVTADDGTWQDALLLNDGVQYTIEFSKDGYDAATTTVTPSA
jgi:hypothetical protein